MHCLSGLCFGASTALLLVIVVYIHKYNANNIFIVAPFPETTSQTYTHDKMQINFKATINFSARRQWTNESVWRECVCDVHRIMVAKCIGWLETTENMVAATRPGLMHLILIRPIYSRQLIPFRMRKSHLINRHHRRLSCWSDKCFTLIYVQNACFACIIIMKRVCGQPDDQHSTPLTLWTQRNFRFQFPNYTEHSPFVHILYGRKSFTRTRTRTPLPGQG